MIVECDEEISATRMDESFEYMNGDAILQKDLLCDHDEIASHNLQQYLDKYQSSTDPILYGHLLPPFYQHEREYQLRRPFAVSARLKILLRCTYMKGNRY